MLRENNTKIRIPIKKNISLSKIESNEKDDDDESLVAQSDCSGAVRSRQSSEGPSTMLTNPYYWASSKTSSKSAVS